MELSDKIELAVISIQDKKNMPAFYSGDVKEVDSELTRLNRHFSTQYKRFPFIYMQENYDEDEIIKGYEYETTFSIFIVGEANADYSYKQRKEKEFPALFTIRDNIVRAMQIKGVEAETNKRKKEYYKSEDNEFSTPINIIQITFNNAKYCLI